MNKWKDVWNLAKNLPSPTFSFLMLKHKKEKEVENSQ
jgi:hypothetical protein